MFIISTASAHAAIDAALPSLEKVMTGASSSGADQVWIRVTGQPANVPSDCVYSTWSLFYIPDDAVINRDRALSILLTAKATGQGVSIQFDVTSTSSDFYGYGISKCVIKRISLGN